MHPGISSMALLQDMLLPDKAGPLFVEALCPTRVTPAGSSMPQQVRSHEHPANMFTLGILRARGGSHIPSLRGPGYCSLLSPSIQDPHQGRSVSALCPLRHGMGNLGWGRQLPAFPRQASLESLCKPPSPHRSGTW